MYTCIFEGNAHAPNGVHVQRHFVAKDSRHGNRVRARVAVEVRVLGWDVSFVCFKERFCECNAQMKTQTKLMERSSRWLLTVFS